MQADHSSHCASGAGDDCAPARCLSWCALEAVDRLLGEAGALTGEEMDRVLDFRWQLHRLSDADATLRLFCELRLRLEQRHYLAFYRIRRWLENHLVAAVRICPAAEPRLVPVKLNHHYCVEAVRRVCLCTALGRDGILLVPRLRFAFRETPLVAASIVPAAEHAALAHHS